MAFNEESNIAALLEALLRQRTLNCSIDEIIVVASGCTDRTEEIVESFVERNPLIELIVQESREGKASAINLFLSRARGDILVIESADTIPHEDTIENLLLPFRDPKVGMTGARPIPINPPTSFMGYTAHLFWRLHHEVALRQPKLGELIALRNIIKEIPVDTAVDEASIEAIITKAGYSIHYAEEAIVRNKGPETVSDFLKQRRRIMVGHKHLQDTGGYVVSTMKITNLLYLLGRIFNASPINPKIIFWTCGSVLLEFTGRLLGDYDYYIKKKNPFAWEIAKSTKNLENDTTYS